MHFGPFHSHHQMTVNLGDEDPLVVLDDRNVLPDRRRVSVRWLTGTVLTGITSVVLMGGALMAALDGQYSVSAATAPAEAMRVSDLENSRGGGSKGDKISQPAAEYANRQIIPVNVVTKDGDREHIGVRDYTLVTSSLATRKNPKLSQEIPAFNPLNMFSDVQTVSESLVSDTVFSNSIYGAKVEGEVSISLTSFPTDSSSIDPDQTPAEADIEKTVRQTARFLAVNTVDTAARTLVDPARFDFNLARQSEFARLAVRITPENVSFISKQDDEVRYTGMDEKIVPIADERDLADVLLDNDANAEEAELIKTAFVDQYGLSMLQPGHRLRIAFAPTPDGSGRMRPERISLYSDTVHQATVARSDTGAYVAAKAPTTFLADAFAEADRISYGGQTPVLYDSLYQTALEQDMDEPLIDELIRIFSFDVEKLITETNTFFIRRSIRNHRLHINPVSIAKY